MRRQKIRQQKKHKVKNKLFIIIVFVFLLFVASLILFFAWSLPRLNKFVFLNQNDSGDGEIIIIDSNKLTKYVIPAHVVMDSSRGFGEYKLESLWILGNKEGYSGQLVVETVAKNYALPIYLWKSKNKSNLNLSQKIKILLSNHSNIMPNKTIDKFELPKSILIDFVDPYVQESGVLVELEDLTANSNTIERVSNILGTTGTKISGYSRGYDENLDCEIIGSNSEIMDTFSKVFGCLKTYDNKYDNQIKIRLGGKFAERF